MSAGDRTGAAQTPAPAVEGEGEPGGVDITQQSLARPTAVMAIGTALSRLTGMLRVVALAFALGVAESRLGDAYNLAYTLPTTIYELVLGGVLSSVFIPVLVEELRTKKRDDAWRAASAIVTVSVTVLLAMVVVTVAAAPLIMEFFTSRAPQVAGAEQSDLATYFLRLFAPMIAFFGLVALGGGLLNAHGVFGPPMFAPIVQNCIQVAVFLAFAAITAGVPTEASVSANTGQKLLLGVGTAVGGAAMAATVWLYVLRLPGRLRFVPDFRHPAVRKVGQLSLWTFVYVILNTIGLMVSFWLAGGIQGGVTAYVTAYAFFQLPIGIAAVSITTALAPKLSAHYVDGDDETFGTRLIGGFRTMTLLLLPATAAFILLAEPMIQTLLEHGIVSGESVTLVSSTLVWFSIGILPFAGFQLLMRAFYTRQDAKTPAIINLGENAATIALDFALFPLWDVRGLAIAHTLGYVVGCVIAVVVLRRRIGNLTDFAFWDETSKVGLATLAAAAVMMLFVLGGEAALPPGDLRALFQLAFGGVGGVAVFVLAAQALGVRDLGTFTALLPARLRPGARSTRPRNA